MAEEARIRRRNDHAARGMDPVERRHGRRFFFYFQAYLADVWSEVGRLKSQGVSAEDAAARADLTRHRQHFPGITAPGVPLIGVTRIYELPDARR